ncbi:MAG: hypothetical protein RL654_1739 [Pseudomonadota bacterium]|jgi:hypothetical protein
MPSAEPTDPKASLPRAPHISTGRMVALLLLGTLLFLVVALMAPWAWQQLRGVPPAAASADATRLLPWQIRPLGNGLSEVFGVTPGRDPLARIERSWPDEAAEMKIALVRDPQGMLTLEAYLETVRAGFVQGRLVLTGAAEPATLQRWADRATEREPQPSGSYRLTLKFDDAQEARQATLAALTFLPAARFDEAVALERFGPAPERIGSADGQVHLLYPERGLVISLDPQGRGKPVLQYVAPRDFARLRAPLVR